MKEKSNGKLDEKQCKKVLALKGCFFFHFKNLLVCVAFIFSFSMIPESQEKSFLRLLVWGGRRRWLD